MVLCFLSISSFILKGGLIKYVGTPLLSWMRLCGLFIAAKAFRSSFRSLSIPVTKPLDVPVLVTKSFQSKALCPGFNFTLLRYPPGFKVLQPACVGIVDELGSSRFENLTDLACAAADLDSAMPGAVGLLKGCFGSSSLGENCAFKKFIVYQNLFPTTRILRTFH